MGLAVSVKSSFYPRFRYGGSGDCFFVNAVGQNVYIKPVLPTVSFPPLRNTSTEVGFTFRSTEQ